MSDDFLLSCRSLYLNGIEPFDFYKQESSEYQRHVALGQQLIHSLGLQEFLGFLMEGHYYVNVWAAFIGLEFGELIDNEILKISGRVTVVDACLEAVSSYYSHCDDFKNRKVTAMNWIQRMKDRYGVIDNC